MEIKDYEISLWEWKIDSNGLNEKKLGIIGASDMSAKSQAFNPILTTKVSAVTTFKFTMYTRYYDEDAQDFVDNPWKSLITNEKIVKLKYDGKWYDFVIKNIQESSSNHTITYDCSDAFVEELSKQGFSLEFNSELNNNMGTAAELATNILSGSNWTIDDNKTEVIRQYTQSLLQEYHQIDHTADLTFTNILDSSDTITLEYQQEGYFYGSAEFSNQYIILEGFSQIDATLTSLDTMPIYTINATLVSPTQITTKGYFLYKSPKSGFDGKIQKSYQVYSKNNTEYNVFNEYKYIAPSTINNYIGTGSTGWTVDNGAVSSSYYPDITLWDNRSKSITEYIYWNKTGSSNPTFYYPLTSQISTFGDFELTKKLVVAVKMKTDKSSETYVNDENNNILTCIIKGKKDNIDTTYFNSQSHSSQNNYNLYTITCATAATWSELQQITNLHLEITSTGSYYIEDIKLFDYVVSSSTIVFPDDQQLSAEAIYTYNVYNPSSSYTSLDDLEIIGSYDTEQLLLNAGYTLVYNINYEKVSSIEASESNRFNLLQKICETFECWLHINVEHDNIGKIGNKKIYFTEKYGSYNSAGFKNGINLSDTTRTIESKDITTYMIVKNNANEFASNGFCSVARSQYNYTGENSFYNFEYFINQGLIDNDTYKNDFFGTQGYYTRLKAANNEYITLSNQISSLLLDISHYTSKLEIATLAEENAQQQKLEYDNEIYQLTNTHYAYIITLTDEPDYWERDSFQTAFQGYKESLRLETLYNSQRATYTSLLETAQSNYTTKLARQATLLIEKNTIYSEINTKYGNFIREGSWIDENYYNDDKYYLDSQIVLKDSAFPKVSYTLKVITIDGIDEYKGYHFNLGDTTYVEDPVIFGYNNDIPVQEEIVISEITYNLADPSKDSIVVKTFESQFETLFQTITAATQSLQFNEGQYSRAAKNITTTGEVSYESIELALNNTQLDLSGVGDQSVSINEKGITTTDINNPNNMVRIIGGGVFLSQDGGVSYNNAISSNGINASYIKTGTLDADKIRIINGNHVSFMWDKDGLNAYTPISGGGYDLNSYARFDYNGIVLVNNGTNIVQLSPDYGLIINADTDLSDSSRSIKFIGRKHDSSGGYYSSLNMGDEFNDGSFGISITGGTSTYSSGKYSNDIAKNRMEINAEGITFNYNSSNSNEASWKQIAYMGTTKNNKGGIVSRLTSHTSILFLDPASDIETAKTLLQNETGCFQLYTRQNKHISCKYIGTTS